MIFWPQVFGELPISKLVKKNKKQQKRLFRFKTDTQRTKFS